MKAVVVGVGDELLSGLVVNTNASMIGELFLAAGVPVVRSVCVGDVEDEIVEVLRDACRSGDVVVVTGGLGPTQDDRTREAMARLLEVGLVRDEAVVDDIRERFRRFSREMPEANAKQGDHPEGTTLIPNAWGTAPGIRAELDGAIVYAIPGVPGEARRMVVDQILPDIGRRPDVAASIRTREVRCVGLPESSLADMFGDLAEAENPKMAFLPGGGEIRLRFVASDDDPSVCERLLDDAEAIVRERLAEVVYGVGDTTLEAVVGGMLRDRGLTVAVAESCTAGMLAARIANVPGASDYLRGGVVGYATDAKASVLGVDVSDGPVSQRTTSDMAVSVRSRFASDVALAITCVAGPDPQDGVPVGTTIIALAHADNVEVRELRLPGDRAQIRQFATTFALNLLRLHLL